MAANSRFAMGVHALALLAAQPDSSLTSEQIATAIGTNPVVIRRILAALRKGGIVHSQKGPSGGTRLAQAPKKITLGNIFQAIEHRPVFAFPYGTGSLKDASHKRTAAAVRDIFDSANSAVAREMDGISIAQIAKKGSKGKK